MTKMGQKKSKKPIKRKVVKTGVIKRRVIKDTPLDILWSRIVRTLAEFKCVECGKNTGQVDAHHWIGRRYKATRWLIENGVCLCHQCHQEMDDFPKFRKDVERKQIGTEKLEQIELMARRGVGIKVDKEKTKEELKRKVKVLDRK